MSKPSHTDGRRQYEGIINTSPLLTHLRMDYGIAVQPSADGCSSDLRSPPTSSRLYSPQPVCFLAVALFGCVFRMHLRQIDESLSNCSETLAASQLPLM